MLCARALAGSVTASSYQNPPCLELLGTCRGAGTAPGHPKPSPLLLSPPEEGRDRQTVCGLGGDDEGPFSSIPWMWHFGDSCSPPFYPWGGGSASSVPPTHVCPVLAQGGEMLEAAPEQGVHPWRPFLGVPGQLWPHQYVMKHPKPWGRGAAWAPEGWVEARRGSHPTGRQHGDHHRLVPPRLLLRGGGDGSVPGHR